MISRDIVSYGYAALALGLMSRVHAAPAATNDPCAEIGGLTFAPPQEALACMKSFPFNATLRQNVIHTVSRVFDFFTFAGAAGSASDPGVIYGSWDFA